MTDPLDILRGGPDRSEPDPEFRARLMNTLRESLAADRPGASAKKRVETEPEEDTQTLRLSDTAHNGSRRGFGAAFVGLAAAVVLVVALANFPREEQPPGGSAATVPTAPAPTPVPPTTAPPTTSAAPSTTLAPSTTVAPTVAPTTTVFVNPLSDADIAANILLDPSEYAPEWTEHPLELSKVLTLDRTLAANVTGCAPFLDTVFESQTRPATTATRTFSSPPGPPATPAQYVVVFPTEDAATAMFDAMLDPLFAGDCFQLYALLTDFNGDKWCCDPQEPGAPALFGTPVSSTTILGSDDIAFRTDNQYWTDATGAVHGPEKVASATVRVGRTITIIEAIITDESGATLTSDQQFRTALATAVQRARTALSGAATG